MVGCFYHQIGDSILASNDTAAFKLGAWVNADHKLLILGLLLVGKLHIEQTKFVPLWFRFATCEQVTSFHWCARHQWDTSAIYNWYSQRISFLQVFAWVI
jgi:hypothetical protein